MNDDKFDPLSDLNGLLNGFGNSNINNNSQILNSNFNYSSLSASHGSSNTIGGGLSFIDVNDEAVVNVKCDRSQLKKEILDEILNSNNDEVQEDLDLILRYLASRLDKLLDSVVILDTNEGISNKIDEKLYKDFPELNDLKELKEMVKSNGFPTITSYIHHLIMENNNSTHDLVRKCDEYEARIYDLERKLFELETRLNNISDKY